MEDKFIFSLDIGTRTVVGILLEKQGDKLILKASEVIEHKNRSMLDGQIHDVVEVAKQIKKIKERLEDKCNVELKKVGIAAAGRALKTIKAHNEIEFNKKKAISDEDVQVLEYGAVQEAQENLFNTEENQADRYHFVGYSVLQNLVDGIKVGNLVGQKGAKIEADVIATFLPQIVVDSLLSAINQAGLEIEHLTLEPIAASNIVVPKQMHNFNLALVDIGAGTSDIAITKNGAIIGFAMVPVAGDEITEAICEHYMVDYHIAEKIKKKIKQQDSVIVKDILGQQLEIKTAEVIEKIESKVDELAEFIAQEILALNNDTPQAIICIGGGSLTPLLEEKLAKQFQLAKNRVGVKDIEDIEEVEGEIKNINGTQAITPFGIGVSYQNNNTETNFIDVTVNGETVNIFTLTKPKISDALLAADVNIDAIKGRPGLAISVEVNGELKMIKGTMGEDGYILLNGVEAELDDFIESDDEIKVKLGSKGDKGTGVIADVVPDLPTREVVINNEKIDIKPIYYMKGKKVSADAKLKDRAQIKYKIPQTVGDILKEIVEINPKKIKNKIIKYKLNGKEKKYKYQNYKILLNGEEVSLEAEINNEDELIVKENDLNQLKIKDILEKEDVNKDITVTFNNKKITIPVKDFKLLKNGEAATKNDLVYYGDEIEYEAGIIRFNQLLDFIDYKIPTSIKGKLVIQKNGEKAKLIEPLSDGDEVKIYTENKRK